jgi:signal transduction histidine kinase
MKHAALSDDLGAFETLGPGQGAEDRRRLTAASARATQRLAALGQMTGGIVHDIRNLFAVVDASLRIAERSLDQPESVRACLASAREGIVRGVGLASELLAFAKQEEFETQDANANDVIRGLERLLRYSAGPGVRVVFALSGDLPNCAIDRTQFEAAVLNLVVNARDAMPDGGRVRISTALSTVGNGPAQAAPPSPYVRVRVQDDGPGMSPEVKRNIFDPFFTTKGDAGVGLGLPQVRASMGLIGGCINVTSEPGMGTIVDLLFPLAAPEGAAIDHAQQRAGDNGNVG